MPDAIVLLEIVMESQIPESIPSPQKPKMIYWLIGTVIIFCFMIIGFIGYYLGNKSSNSQQDKNIAQGQFAPITTPKLNTPTAVMADRQVDGLPSGWSYKNNAECGVKFAIPPKLEPYYIPYDPNRQPSVTDEMGSGRFWDFPRGGSYPNLLSKVFLANQEYKQAITMFAAPEEASGYISQAVAVSCIPNNGRFTDNNAFIATLTAEIEKYNKSTGEKGMQASTYKIKSNTAGSRWSQSIVDLVVAEDSIDTSYTMFVTPQYIYEVKLFGETTNAFIKDTARKIFDSLAF